MKCNIGVSRKWDFLSYSSFRKLYVSHHYIPLHNMLVSERRKLKPFFLPLNEWMKPNTFPPRHVTLNSTILSSSANTIFLSFFFNHLSRIFHYCSWNPKCLSAPLPLLLALLCGQSETYWQTNAFRWKQSESDEHSW